MRECENCRTGFSRELKYLKHSSVLTRVTVHAQQPRHKGAPADGLCTLKSRADETSRYVIDKRTLRSISSKHKPSYHLENMTQGNGMVRKFKFVSLSGGGYRAALYNAGVLRALHAANILYDADMIVNAVSGGSIPAVLWRHYLKAGPNWPTYWPEDALLELVSSTPRLGGRFNWTLRGLHFRSTKAWQKFLENWWARLPTLPKGSGGEPTFLIEALNYHTGEFWSFDRHGFAPATRNYLKTRTSIDAIAMSEIQAIAVATAFPILFQGLSTHYPRNPHRTVHLKDAGLVDNMAIMPLLPILRHDHVHSPVGTVERWILSNAGSPLAVTSSFEGAFMPGGLGRPSKIGLIDHLFRLTGDLAQPAFVHQLAGILRDYAGVKFIGVALGTSADGEAPWCVNSRFKAPSNMSTHLGYVSKAAALCVMAEGAQAMSKALLLNGLINPNQRSNLEQFMTELANSVGRTALPSKLSANYWIQRFRGASRS